MKKDLNKFIKSLSPNIIDKLIFPHVFISALILLFVRRIGINKLSRSKQALLKVGIMPIRNHYYEPLFDKRNLYKPLSEKRQLPGIDWNTSAQIKILDKFQFNNEFENIPDNYINDLSFNFNNGAFGPGDAEYWYNLIRLIKPNKIIEIGSGHSTKIAQMAIKKNIVQSNKYSCTHICIEPYEMPWLEELNIEIIREKVEHVDKSIFNRLENNDILFIDSSHIIRPQGDVLFVYLELLPTLNPGVIVHIHDTFSPRDYPEKWVIDEVRFWNEQYLLEAFLTSNSNWEIIGALNFLHHKKYSKLKNKCPRLTPENEPGSFYIRKLL